MLICHVGVWLILYFCFVCSKQEEKQNKWKDEGLEGNSFDLRMVSGGHSSTILQRGVNNMKVFL